MEKMHLSYTPITYAPNQFIDFIEKRVKKELRVHGLDIKKTVYIFNDRSKEYKVSKALIETIFNKRLKLHNTTTKKYPLIIPTNLEREINTKFECLLAKKPFPKTHPGEIKLLQSVLEEELVLYAKLKKIRIAKTEEKINPIIMMLQHKYPETKFSLHKSFELIK